MITKDLYNTYVQILKDELRPAMGCTEPISIAYAAAEAKKILGDIPDKVEIEVSRNIIKNVKSVVVPHTGGMRGIQAAAAAGIIGGNAEKELEVLESVTDGQIQEMKGFLKQIPCEVKCSDSDFIFDIRIILHKDQQEAEVRIVDFHTNIVLIRKNQEILYSKEIAGRKEADLADKSLLTIEQIYEFADMIRIKDVKEILDRQISYCREDGSRFIILVEAQDAISLLRLLNRLYRGLKDIGAKEDIAKHIAAALEYDDTENEE